MKLYSDTTSCIQIVGGVFDLQHYYTCMGTVLAPDAEYPAISTECTISAFKFILEYDLNMTPEELSYSIGGFGNYCGGNPEAFNEYVWSQIVFKEAVDEARHRLNLENLSNCFHDARFCETPEYSYTIYVQQPIPNSRTTYTTGSSGSLGSGPDKINSGHTFMSLEIKCEDYEEYRVVMGFYPRANTSPTPSNPNVEGGYYDDTGREYHVSAKFELDSLQFANLISEIETFNERNYDLNEYNCTDFCVEAGNEIDLNIPDTRGTWHKGGGTNPADLGEDLRILTGSGITIDGDGGTASHSTCNL